MDGFCNEHTQVIEGISEIKTDVKWIRKELCDRNKEITDHINESTSFRDRVSLLWNASKILLYGLGAGFLLKGMSILWQKLSL